MKNPTRIREEKSELKKSSWGEVKRGIRHAEDMFLEPVQGIWSYAWSYDQSDRAGREEKKEM